MGAKPWLPPVELSSESLELHPLLSEGKSQENYVQRPEMAVHFVANDALAHAPVVESLSRRSRTVGGTLVIILTPGMGWQESVVADTFSGTRGDDLQARATILNRCG